MTESRETVDRGRARLPRGVWALGFVAMFMDISSEMIHGLLPVFLVTVLGASPTIVGAIEGVGEATASFAKLLSGWLSDRLGRRKTLTVIGYALAALSKPLFALAPSAAWVMAARFSDRVGKGIRGAPRDALIGDLAPAGLRGAAFGLRQSLDTVGAFAGPVIAIALMAWFENDFRTVFWLAAIPAFVAVVILIKAVHEPLRSPGDNGDTKQADASAQPLGALFWGLVAVGAVLTLARFSEAFLILRAKDQGLPLALAPIVLVVMNLVYAGAAYPIGWFSDRHGRRPLLAAGLGVLILADLVLAFATGLLGVFAGIALWGLHMGMTQGLLMALVADVSPAARRGLAFGVFHFVTGAALLVASIMAGALWEFVGPSATFLAGAGLTALGLLVLMILRRR